MNRRQVLMGCGTALVGLNAGCLGGDDGEETPPATPTVETSEPEPTPTATPERTPDRTPTESPTPDPVPTPTEVSDEDVFTHDLNTRFTVGEDGNAVTYRIIEYHRADRIGDRTNWSTARRTYLIVVAELTNPQETQISVPRDDFRVRSSETWRKFGEEPTEKIEIDDRLSVRSLANQAVPPGRSITGATAFDVDPDGTYDVWITPMDGPDTPQHFVPVGEISSIPELS